MNDVCESCKVVYNKYTEGRKWKIDNINTEISKYIQISMTNDSDCRFGFDLQQMWGLYAEKGKGVCLVYDKDEIEKALSPTDMRGMIKYCCHVTPDEIFDMKEEDNLEECVKKYAKQQFFRKRKEWEWEQEYRILRRGNEKGKEFLDISNSLKYIIMQNANSQDAGQCVVDSIEYKIMEAVAGEIPIFVYTHFIGEQKLDYKNEFTIWDSKNQFEQKSLGVNIDV